MSRRPVLAVVAGAAAGFVAGWWWGRSSAEAEPGAAERLEPPVDESWADRWGERVDAAVGVAADGFRTMGTRLWAAPPIDETMLERTLSGVPGAEGLEARVLGAGLVEVVGEASDDGAKAAVEALEASPGVRVVLRRAWTPSSADPGQIDDLPGFG